jgi:hypothetical protein
VVKERGLLEAGQAVNVVMVDVGEGTCLKGAEVRYIKYAAAVAPAKQAAPTSFPGVGLDAGPARSDR